MKVSNELHKTEYCLTFIMDKEEQMIETLVNGTKGIKRSKIDLKKKRTVCVVNLGKEEKDTKNKIK